MSWGSFFTEIAKSGNAILNHNIKPAIEKLRDIRFEDLKKWNRWKKKSDKKQAERKEKADQLRKL